MTYRTRLTRENDAAYLRYVASVAPTVIDVKRLDAIAGRIERTESVTDTPHPRKATRFILTTTLVMTVVWLLLGWTFFAMTEPCHAVEEWIICRR